MCAIDRSGQAGLSCPGCPGPPSLSNARWGSSGKDLGLMKGRAGRRGPSSTLDRGHPGSAARAPPAGSGCAGLASGEPDLWCRWVGGRGRRPSRPGDGSRQQMGGGRLPVCSSNGHALWRRVWARWGRGEQPGHTQDRPTLLPCDLPLFHGRNPEPGGSLNKNELRRPWIASSWRGDSGFLCTT